MAGLGELLMAAQGASDRDAFESAYDKEGARRTKAGKWGGWGRTLGLLGTAGLIAATGGLAGLPLALKAGLVGLGGLGGRSFARSISGGRERDADKSVDALFHQGEQRKFAKDIGDYQAGMRERMLTDAATDAFSAYLMGGAGEKIAKWGADKPKFLGDWGAKTFGVGGEQFAAETTAKGLADNPWLAGASEADDLWASGIDSVAGSVNPAAAGMNLGPVAGSAVGTDLSNITNPLGADTSPVVSSPYSPTAPTADTYGAAVAKGRAMGDQGMLNDTIRQSLGLPTGVPDQMGGMNYEQWMGQSDQAFEAFMNQGQEGSLLDLIQNQDNVGQPAWWGGN